MTQPERIWRNRGAHAAAENYGLASWPSKDLAEDGAGEYIRADVAKEMVDAERERCATLCETREMGVAALATKAKWAGAYTDGPRGDFGKHAGMGYAEMLRATK
jgi:hypothetical protein